MTRLGIPLDTTKMGSEAKTLEEGLKHRLVGQGEAVRQIVDAYQMHLTGLTSPNRPIANLLFLGPTGSGKTRAVEALAESLLGSPRAVIKIDCAEFQHSHEIAKLVGSPPGYLGHRETHPMLCPENLNQFHTERVKVSFVLFDEIEKASDALWNLLLGILDKATLTLGDGRRVDFSRSMIFMTSNLGAEAMSSLMAPKIGFLRGDRSDTSSPSVTQKVEETALEAARRKFTPEFINRLDKMVVFHPLGDTELQQVLDIELRMVQERIFRGSDAGPFVCTLSREVRSVLLTEGTDPRYGARHLKRAVERILVQPLSNLIASGQVRAGDWIQAEFDSDLGRVIFFREAEGMTAYGMAEVARGVNVIRTAAA